MSDLELFKDMLSRANIEYSVHEEDDSPLDSDRRDGSKYNQIVLEFNQSEHKHVGGYCGFFTVIAFNKEDGRLLEICAYE